VPPLYKPSELHLKGYFLELLGILMGEQAEHTILIWTIQLLGGIGAHGPQGQVRRFRTQKSASLLAYLALHPAPQPREALINLLWPDSELEAGRHNLSMALSFLRHQLEPPGVPPGSVIVADRFSVRLNPAAVAVDALEFESALRRVDELNLPDPERLVLLLEASERYQGPLLPGLYEDWIAPQAIRLEGIYINALAKLVELLLADGKQTIASMYAQKAVDADPLSEVAIHTLIRSLVKSGHPQQALKAYRTWELRLSEELGATPSAGLQRLAADLSKGGRDSNPAFAADVVEVFPLPVPTNPKRLVTELGRDAARFASPNRLIGPEFLLRTTTRFFGREEEVDCLSQMLNSPRSRLVTLTGAGGTGKTRLAVEVAAQLAEDKAGGGVNAIFVSLGCVADPERIFEVILRSLGVTAASKHNSLDQLASVLNSRPRTLLLLDNFEQLVPTGALLIRDLLSSTDSVKMLVTSRQHLLVEGEREYQLSPLPTAVEARTPEALLSVPSVALFVDRAQAVQPDFQITPRNASVVASLCEILEGLPLAIELAAARIGSYSPSRIVEQVQADRFEFLASRRRDAQSRHQNLRATLDWSFKLLPEAAQDFLAGLSVFRGGWTVSAASTVCSVGEKEAQELLALLLDNSLIRVTDQADGIRFTILETIREYGWERLIDSGQKDLMCRRHRDYFAVLADQAESELTGPSQVMWINRLQTEHNNFCAAVERCEKDEAGAEAGLKMAGALWPFWEVRGYLSLGRRYLARALESGDSSSPTPERAKALYGAAALAAGQGDFDEARVLLQECLNDYEVLNDCRGIGASKDSLGRLAAAQGDYRAAQALCKEGLDILRKLGDEPGIASSLFNLAYVTWALGGQADATAMYEESLMLRRDTGDYRGIANTLARLGHIAYIRGEYGVAQTLMEESLVILRTLGDKGGIAQSLSRIGMVAAATGNHDLARTFSEECLTIQTELGDRDGAASAHYWLGQLAFRQGDPETAMKQLRESLNLLRQTGGHFLIHVLGLLGHVARDIKDYHLAKDNYRESLHIRAGRSDLLAIAQSFEDFAALAWREGQDERSARLLGAAESVCISIGQSVPAGPEDDYGCTLEIIRQRLEPDAFAAAWANGRAMTVEQSIDYAMEVTA